MEATPELIDSIYIEKVLRARQTPIGEKLLDGPRLFALECEAVRAEIRKQQPNASSADIRRILREQLEAARLLEEEGLYVNGPPPPKSASPPPF
jgi:hypothetical protein